MSLESLNKKYIRIHNFFYDHPSSVFGAPANCFKNTIYIDKHSRFSADHFHTVLYTTNLFPIISSSYYRLSFTLNNPCIVRIFKANEFRPPILITEKEINKKGESVIEFNSNSEKVKEGRFFAQFQAIDCPVTISNAGWDAFISQKEITLAIVIVTMGNRNEPIDLIKSIEGYLPIKHDSIKFYVINQGKVNEFFKQAKNVNLITQENFGASGGWARGFTEAINDNCSHILIVDDDVLTTPESIFRTFQLASVAKNEIAFGSTMFDAYRPEFVIDGGGMVHFDNTAGFLSSYNSGLDVTKQSSLNSFDSVKSPHFLGFWMACFPVSVIKKTGLPFPFFLKFDDVEYCLRAMRNGGKLFSVSSIYCWHEPGDAKDSYFQWYFFYKNWIILHLLHRQNLNVKQFITTLREKYISFIAVHDYGMAMALLEAVADVVKGTERHLGRYKFTLQYIEKRCKSVDTRYTINARNMLKELRPHPTAVSNKKKAFISTFRWSQLILRSLGFSRIPYGVETYEGFIDWPHRSNAQFIGRWNRWLSKNFLHRYSRKRFSYINKRSHLVFKELETSFTDLSVEWRRLANRFFFIDSWDTFFVNENKKDNKVC